MTYSISKKELSPQHVLYRRRRVKPSEIAAALGEILPAVFQHARAPGCRWRGRRSPATSRWDRGS